MRYELALAWQHLILRRWVVLESFTTPDCYGVMFDVRTGQDRKPLGPKIVEDMKGILEGKSLKVISIERNRSDSGIAGSAKAGLARMGIKAIPRNMPVYLAVFYHAHFGLTDITDGEIEFEGKTARLTIERIEAPAKPFLGEMEFEVLGRYLDGLDYQTIAKQRDVAFRTVHAQVQSIHDKLGVSQRNHVIAFLTREHARLPAVLAERAALVGARRTPTRSSRA